MFFSSSQHSNNALREQLFDYLKEARRQELLYNQRKELEKEIEQYRENRFGDDENNSSDDDESNGNDEQEKTSKIYFFLINEKNNFILLDVRRKAVGLGDNPFK